MKQVSLPLLIDQLLDVFLGGQSHFVQDFFHLVPDHIAQGLTLLLAAVGELVHPLFHFASLKLPLVAELVNDLLGLFTGHREQPDPGKKTFFE